MWDDFDFPCLSCLKFSSDAKQRWAHRTQPSEGSQETVSIMSPEMLAPQGITTTNSDSEVQEKSGNPPFPHSLKTLHTKDPGSLTPTKFISSFSAHELFPEEAGRCGSQWACKSLGWPSGDCVCYLSSPIPSQFSHICGIRMSQMCKPFHTRSLTKGRWGEQRRMLEAEPRGQVTSA